jgi:hypothetical protein
MFNSTAKMIFANLGLATVIKNRLTKVNPGAQYELKAVPTGVQIVRVQDPEPVVETPAIETKEQLPVAAGELCTLHLQVKSEGKQWLHLSEPLLNGSYWLDKGHLVSFEDDGAGTWIVAVPSKLAKRKKWVGIAGAGR